MIFWTDKLYLVKLMQNSELMHCFIEKENIILEKFQMTTALKAISSEYFVVSLLI